MANKLTQFEEDVPIIRDQPIVGKEKGYDAYAQVLGTTSEVLTQTSKKMGEDQSNAMFLQSQAHADTIKTNTQIAMLQNPQSANDIYQKAQEDYASVTQEAFVNDADRNKLKFLATKDLNDIKMAAARTDIENSKRTSQVTFFTNWPTILQGLKESIGNEKEFNVRMQAAQQGIEGLLYSGSITPLQANKLGETISHLVKSSHDYLQRFGNGDMDAKEYNRQDQKTNYGATTGIANNPVDQNTAYLASNHSEDLSVEGIKSDLANGKIPSAEAWANISEKKQGTINDYHTGTSSVDADFFKTGVPLNQLQDEYKDLSTKSELSSTEHGRKDRIQNILNDLKKGLSYKLIRNNTLFQGAMVDYNHTIEAVRNNPNLSNDEKLRQVQNADNKLANNGLATMESMHFQDNITNPIPFNFIQNGQRSFDPDGDPSALRTNMGYWNKNLREYYARGLATPVQQEVARAVSNLDTSKIQPEDIDRFIKANRKGQNFSGMATEKKEFHDAIRDRLYKVVNNNLMMIGQMPDGGQRVDALMNASVNYIKQQALENGDPNFTNVNTYTDNAAQFIQQAYPIAKGVNWTINKQDFPNVTPPQMDNVSKYLIDYTKNNIIGVGVNKFTMSAALDRNQLHVIGTPSGKLLVKDGYGNLQYSIRYNDNLLAKANQYQEKIVTDAIHEYDKAYKEQSAFKRYTNRLKNIGRQQDDK